ncbi:hypothetical protein LTR97_006290 [Elasticomyces elasticus]|uniref:Uncharacterized protein n=1 Tax=Elasticomyces elasticus TaxID=574655 RepID=A0AAN7W652_9PEZI|nr:hypothetical protein LTR97_006290 [Elasticomyces elasticus]
MDAIKSVVGLGKKEQEGQEPVSGVKGEGSAAQPYDAGNEGSSELGGKAAQHTDATSTTAQPAVDDKAAAAVDSTTTSGKSEQPIASAPVPAATSASGLNESETSKAPNSSESKKPLIGSPGWFKTAIPFGQRKDEAPKTSNEPQASAGAVGSGVTQKASEPETGLPPNHIGANVPNSTEPLDTPATSSPTFGETTSPISPTSGAVPEHREAAMHDTNPAPTTEHPQSSVVHQDAKMAAEQPSQYMSEGGPSQSSSSGGGLFSNPFGSSSKKIENDSPTEKRRLSREMPGNNPDRIPTAGGVRIGSVAYESRKSQDVRRSMSVSQPAIPDEDEEEPARATPAMSNVPSSLDSKTDTTAASSIPSATTPSTTSAVKSDEAPPRASLSPSEGRDHSRRKSIFDKVKEKLPGHHHK